jgi:hypothetical protein
MPTDTNRPSLKADEEFFNTDMKGNGKSCSCFHSFIVSHTTVPVIAVFTKYDGLVIEAESQLLAEGRNEKEAEDEAPNRARAILATNFREPLEKAKFSPSEHVTLAGNHLSFSREQLTIFASQIWTSSLATAKS